MRFFHSHDSYTKSSTTAHWLMRLALIFESIFKSLTFTENFVAHLLPPLNSQSSLKMLVTWRLSRCSCKIFSHLLRKRHRGFRWNEQFADMYQHTTNFVHGTQMTQLVREEERESCHQTVFFYVIALNFSMPLKWNENIVDIITAKRR